MADKCESLNKKKATRSGGCDILPPTRDQPRYLGNENSIWRGRSCVGYGMGMSEAAALKVERITTWIMIGDGRMYNASCRYECAPSSQGDSSQIRIGEYFYSTFGFNVIDGTYQAARVCLSGVGGMRVVRLSVLSVLSLLPLLSLLCDSWRRSALNKDYCTK